MVCRWYNSKAVRRDRGSAVIGALVAALVLLGGARAAHADIWVLDKSASVVQFSYDHLGLSRQGGRIGNLEGRLEFSPTDPEAGAVDITARTASISTGVTELDQLLRSVDFFNAQRHPTIHFKSVAVRKSGERRGEVDGELTMLGMTQPVTLQVVWNFTGEYPLSAINPTYQGKWVSGFSASTVIERSKWGMKRGIPLLSDEITLAIEVEFLKAD